MRRYVIVDIDGTLSDSSAREHYAQNKDWAEFHHLSSEDKPVEAVVEFVHAMNEAGFRVIACTGRPEKYRKATFDWMLRNEVSIDLVLMRPELDFSSDADLKPRLVREHLSIRTKGDWEKAILCVLEDRDIMVEKWRSLGIDCWQVKSGGY
jgi:FMN phosphatase YigB (HAD superfamily)